MNSTMTRRGMLTASLATLAGVAAHEAEGAASPADGPVRLGEVEIGSPHAFDDTNFGHSVNVSPDKLATTVLFGRKDQEDGKKNSGLSLWLDKNEEQLTKTGAVQLMIPQAISRAAGSFVYFVVLRGFISKDPGVRIGLTLDAGCTTHTYEFPFGMRHEDDFTKALSTQPPTITKPARARRCGRATRCELLPLPEYAVGLHLVIQRTTTSECALVVIDSLNIEVRPPSPPVTRRRRWQRMRR